MTVRVGSSELVPVEGGRELTFRVDRLILKSEVFQIVKSHAPSKALAEHLKEMGLPEKFTHASFAAWERASSSEGLTVVEGVTLQLREG